MNSNSPHHSSVSILMLAVVAVLAASAPARSLAAPTSPKTHENPVLRVEVTGKGRPMVLIPGLTCSADVWRETVAKYASRYQCHAVTLGGFAGRPRYEGPFLDTARDSLLAYFKAQGLARPVIVGHSLGGVLALELAAAAPDAIGPLVIVDALPFLGGAGDSTATAESARKAMEPLWKMMRGQSQGAYAAYQRQAPYLKSMVAPGPNYDRMLEWAITSDRIAVADAMYDIGSRDLRGTLPALRSPVLVLGSWYGMKEFSTRAAVEATFRRQFAGTPQWTLAVADTARHFIMLDSPEWTWSQMDAFFANGSSASKQ
jgi:N-formylmaleamate deformylase